LQSLCEILRQLISLPKLNFLFFVKILSPTLQSTGAHDVEQKYGIVPSDKIADVKTPMSEN